MINLQWELHMDIPSKHVVVLATKMDHNILIQKQSHQNLILLDNQDGMPYGNIPNGQTTDSWRCVCNFFPAGPSTSWEGA
jgi:hypothetical protein